jgi:hypothetical protein
VNYITYEADFIPSGICKYTTDILKQKAGFGNHENREWNRLRRYFTSKYCPGGEKFVLYTGSWVGKDLKVFWQRGLFCLPHKPDFYRLVASLMVLLKLVYIWKIPSTNNNPAWLLWREQ